MKFAVAAMAALFVLTGCSSDERPKTPELSATVVAIVDGGDCLNLDDNIARANAAGGAWGEQYLALLMWKGRQLGCDWAS